MFLIIQGERLRTKERPNTSETTSVFFNLARYFFEKNALAMRTTARERKIHPTIIRGL